MNNDNPANMSNDDLEKDMEKRRQESASAGGENNANTSEEAEVKPPEKKTMDMGVDFESDKEQDLDDLVHQQAKVDSSGNMPDPETLSFREGQ